MPIKAQQIQRFFTSFVRLNGISANGGSTVITTAISTALSTAGDNGVSVPVQVATSDAPGLVTTGLNRVPILTGATEEPIYTVAGDKVYARLTEASGVYTITYFSLADGVETAYSFGSATTIDVFISYCFDFHRVPKDFGVRVWVTDLNEVELSSGTTQNTFTEQLTVSGTDTLSNLTKTPISATAVKLFVNGVAYFPTSHFTVNVGTRAITWNAVNSKYTIVTDDTVFVEYETLQ